jgi:hypothetical protein
MWRRLGLLSTDVSEERIVSIFRVEEITRTGKGVRRSLTDRPDNKPTRLHIPGDSIHHSHRRENPQILLFFVTSWRTTPCRLFGASYSIHSQLPSISNPRTRRSLVTLTWEVVSCIGSVHAIAYP